MNLHKEIFFEDEICSYLGAHGWLHESGDALHYDRAHALYPPDVIAWVQESQPKVWETLTQKHGTHAETILLERIRKQMNQVGTLDVLRHGVDVLGLRSPVLMAQFKPALGMNPEL